MKKMDLMKFGMEVLGYKNENNCVRNFISKFNEKMGFEPMNNTATEKELVRFSMNASKKELKLWATEKLAELLTETEEVVRENYVLPQKQVKPKETKPTKAKEVKVKEKAVPQEDLKAKALLDA